MKRILLLSGVSGVLLVFGIFLFAGCGGDDDDVKPSNFRVTAEVLSTSSIRLSWDKVSGATSYVVERSASRNGTYTQVSSSTALSYTDTELLPNTTYYYNVTVFTASAIYSVSVSATTSAPPANVTAEVQILGSIRISWDEVSGAKGYNVYSSATAEGSYTKLGTGGYYTPTTTTTSFTHTGLTEGATYYYTVSAVISRESEGDVESPRSAYVSATNSSSNINTKREGVYIGIISFAGNAGDVTGGVPVLLDAAGKTTLINKLTSNYTIAAQSGTALFYSVHQALANLKAREDQYPDNLDSVNVITFTDGLDNASVGKSMLTPIEDQTFSSEDEYTTYLSGQIASRTIAGKPITAYSVGVMGSDVTNTEKFTSDLKKIASTGKSQSLTDFGNLQTTFQDIADSLEITQTTSVAFTLKTTLLPNGAKVRMTFDTTGTSSSDAAAASRYIEGTISATGSGASLSYTFNSITYSGGFGSEQGAGPITGVIDGSEVKFAFTNVTGYNPVADESRAKQWLMRSGETAWQINSEYSVTGATNTEIDSRSSIIYLVLDSSTSLNTTQIEQIRGAAAAFINSLFSQLVGFVTSGVSATAESSNSITVSWNRVSDASGYYVYRSTSSDGPYSRIGPTNATISSTSYTDTGLSANTTYYYKVSAYNSSYGEGAQSSYASAKTMAVGTPQGVSAEVVSSSSIRVQWYSVSGASGGYKVYRSTSSDGSYEEVKDSPPLSSIYSVGSYTDTGLLSATTYYYKVSAYNANGEGARSSYVSATTSSP